MSRAKTNINQISTKSGIADLTQASFGQNGYRIIDETTLVNSSERFFCILALFDSSVDVVSNAETGDASSTAIPLLTGMQIFGIFSDVTVATGGKVIAYLI